MPAHRAEFRRELATMGNPKIILALLVSGFTWAGFIAVFTFISPILGEVSGVSEHAIVWVLLLFGVGMTIGNFVGGRLADWRLVPSIIGMIAATAVVLAVIAFVLHDVATAVAALICWGVLVFALAPALQYWVVKEAPDAPNAASTINQASFHLGAAAGAWLSACALHFGIISYSHLPWVGEVLTLTALAIAVTAVSIEHGHRKLVFSHHAASPMPSAR
jgi:DHA1 family inner membrane transport protein